MTYQRIKETCFRKNLVYTVDYIYTHAIIYIYINGLNGLYQRIMVFPPKISWIFIFSNSQKDRNVIYR